MAWIGGGLIGVAGLVWLMLLPLRQAPYTVESHGLRSGAGQTAIEGRLRNRGDAVPALLIEAYLYDTENRYLGTAQSSLTAVPARTTVDFRIPVEPRAASRVERYSLYAGTTPNPFAPEP